MTRRTALGLWAALIVACLGAGTAIAGLPAQGSGVAAIDHLDDTSSGSGDGSDTQTTEPADTTTTTSTTTTTTASTTTASTTTTSTEPEARPNEEVPVLVANGTDVVGAAGRITDELAAQGHPTSTPLTTREFQSSEIWFADGFGIEAVALAERLGVFPENVAAMPDNPGFPTGGAAIVVILGPDLAGN